MRPRGGRPLDNVSFTRPLQLLDKQNLALPQYTAPQEHNLLRFQVSQRGDCRVYSGTGSRPCLGNSFSDRTLNLLFKDVCLIQALQRLGFDVPVTSDGPFWLFQDGCPMLAPFRQTLVPHVCMALSEGKYICHQDHHFRAVRVLGNGCALLLDGPDDLECVQTSTLRAIVLPSTASVHSMRFLPSQNPCRTSSVKWQTPAVKLPLCVTLTMSLSGKVISPQSHSG